MLRTWDQRVNPDSASTSPDERVATKAVRTLMVLAAGKMTWEWEWNAKRTVRMGVKQEEGKVEVR
jgi:hypothetical protein